MALHAVGCCPNGYGFPSSLSLSVSLSHCPSVPCPCCQCLLHNMKSCGHLFVSRVEDTEYDGKERVVGRGRLGKEQADKDPAQESHCLCRLLLAPLSSWLVARQPPESLLVPLCQRPWLQLHFVGRRQLVSRSLFPSPYRSFSSHLPSNVNNLICLVGVIFAINKK